MASFLQLAQSVKRESGLTGGGPAAYATAIGDDLRIFNWVAWSWRAIDLLHEGWLWRRASAVATTTGSMTLSPTSVVGGFGLQSFGSWMQASRDYQPTTYKVSDGQQAEQRLTFWDYDVFRMRFVVGTHTAGAPSYWSVAPNGSLMVGPTPAAPYVVRAEYIKDHIPLAADTDTPTMPTRFHEMIVWRALREYGGYDAAGEVWQRADANYNALLSELSQAQLPKMRWGGRPLA